MSIPEETRKRIISIYEGIAVPQTGMEKHFARVCRGEAIPVTNEEREWYQFVTDEAAVAAQRESERIDEEVARRVDEATRFNEQRVTHFIEVVERQQQLIQTLMKQLEESKRQLRQYEAKSSLSSGSRGICPVCDGDGGAKGECYTCGGTGWISA